MRLRISTDLALPLDAVTDTFAILAVRGVGKTHTASVMAEEMLKAGQPIVAYDPTGAWWGLKSSADGKRPGFPVVVFGGEHADVPLEETAGATIATTIVEKRIPAILDCVLMRKGARVRFMTDFCETLYHKNREALHLFLDEAHTVAPQNVRAMPEAARLLGAVEDIVLQGRRRGLGLTAISQRPALLNTNIRSQCMTLVAMRIFGKHDRKAIDEWIEAHGDPQTARAMIADLAALPKGDAWVWNAAAELFKRVHFRERETFDSSATPKVGGKVITPQRMAEVDLDKLGQAIKATVEKAKADDPKALRSRIAELEKQLKGQPAATRTVEVEKRVEVPVLKNGQLERIESLGAKVATVVEQFNEAARQFCTAIQPAVVTKPQQAKAILPPVAKPVSIIPKSIPAPRREKPTAAAGDLALTKKQQQILDAIAWWESLGVAEPRNEQIGAIALIDTSGGYFSNMAGPLATAGLIERGSGSTRLTDAGRAVARPIENVATLADYHNVLRDRVRKSRTANGKTLAILDVMIEQRGADVETSTIGEFVGIDHTGGYFSNSIGPLSTMGLIERRAGVVRPTDLLFPEGMD